MENTDKSAASGSYAVPTSQVAASIQASAAYALDPLDRIKRASSQSYDVQSGMGSLSSGAQTDMRKARFVSDGSIPTSTQHAPTTSSVSDGFTAPTSYLGNGTPFHPLPSLESAPPPPPTALNGAARSYPEPSYTNLPFMNANNPYPPYTAFGNAFIPAMTQPNPLNRTVYVGNLPADASVDELLNLVKFGPIENVRILPEKNCAFISFLDGTTAAAFHADACVKKVSLHNQELKIGWGKPSHCSPNILMAVQQNQASRNVYLGQLDENVGEQSLRDDLSRFGPIDQVKIVRDKNIGFVHFLSVQTAIKVVAMLPTEPEWAGKRVHYGKDRCAYVPKSQQQNQAHNNQAAAMGLAAAASLGYPTAFSLPDDAARSAGSVYNAPPPPPPLATLQQLGNRTVYLGNIHPDTTTEEICNHIRGGILQNVRYIAEKHIAFVTFVDANTALAFYHLASYSGIMIHNRRLKIGWGKHSGPPSPAIQLAVQAGGSRNVYIGNIDDPDTLTQDKIRSDFSQYGELEMVNSLREKNCAFANFTNIQSAIKCIEGIKNHPDYQHVKISYGKDRCGNPPRTTLHHHHAAAPLRKTSGGSVSPKDPPIATSTLLE